MVTKKEMIKELAKVVGETIKIEAVEYIYRDVREALSEAKFELSEIKHDAILGAAE